MSVREYEKTNTRTNRRRLERHITACHTYSYLHRIVYYKNNERRQKRKKK